MPTSDRFLFAVEGLPQTLRVLRLFGQEGVSELFQFELTIACEDGALDFADVVGATALLSMHVSPEETRFVHGIVSRFEQASAGHKLVNYHATVVPRAFRLQHRHDCRIFQDLTTPAIVKKVLEAAGLRAGDDFRLAVQGSPRKHEYCVQYRESDWAFVCRLLEEDGLHFFFDHQEDKHVLVIADRAAAHSPIAGDATVLFRPSLGALTGGEHVQRFHYAEQIRSGKVTVRDYEFKKPSLLLESKSEASSLQELEVYDYPARFESPGDGDGVAKIRLEQHQALRRIGEGDSACARLVPGQLFTLGEHPREPFNREYLITRVEHRGFEPSSGEAIDAEVRYENRFQVIPSDVPFRPAETTAKPVVRGLQSAVVVGPPGEEIYTDEHGRVKVQFHWDRLGKKDDQSSCWLRVAQISAGAAFGAMVLPRISQEVLVDFLEGDPDRPIVIGSVYHGTNVPPYALPANKTRTTLKTSSTPGGGGSNELRFEDKKGSEEVYLHGQKDWTIAIENDQNATVGHDETLDVKNDRTMTIGANQSEQIGKDETFVVGGNRSKSVGKDESESIGQNRTIEVGADHTESIGGGFALTVGKGQSVEVGEDATESIGTMKIVKVGQDYQIEVGSNAKSKVSGAFASKVELDAKVEVGSKITIVCGDSTVTIEKNGSIKVEGKSFEVAATGPVKVNADKVEVKSSGEVKIEASGKVEVKGSGPMELNASGAVKVKGANVGIN